mgnify:CR=1 FL=1
MKTFVLAALLLSAAAQAEDGQFIFSAAASHPAHESDYEAFTPGVSYRRGGYEGGVYRNSLGRISVYGAAVIDTPVRDLRLLIGAVTGYMIPIAPAIVPVYAITERFELLIIPPLRYRGVRVDTAVSVRVMW